MTKRIIAIQWTVRVLLGVVVILFLYVASYGPANSLVARGYLSPRKVDAFYRPLPDKLIDVIIGIWTKIDRHPGVFERV
jgi:hypothetical protein